MRLLVGNGLIQIVTNNLRYETLFLIDPYNNVLLVVYDNNVNISYYFLTVVGVNQRDRGNIVFCV